MPRDDRDIGDRLLTSMPVRGEVAEQRDAMRALLDATSRPATLFTPR